MNTDQYVLHADPAWRDRADFVINAVVPGVTDRYEQLWAHRLDSNFEFELCCIPFFLYDVSLGDVVETDSDHVVARVVRPSGRYVFRVWFGESFFPRDEIARRLEDIGALTEWSSVDLLAVDAVDDDLASQVAGFLADCEERRQLIYETGRLAST